MAVLIFVFKLIAGSGLLYGYYHLFLRNRRFHAYNRFYLLASMVISLVLPLVHIPVDFLWGHQPNASIIRTLRVINANGWEEPVTIYASRHWWNQWLTVQNGLYIIYLAGLATGLVVLVRSLARIKTFMRKYPYETIDRLRIYYTEEPGTPFSFFRSIFWDKRISLHETRGQQIFRHELFHVKERHSTDVLLAELICCCCWFNPFYQLFKKELKAIHEFLADEYAISANNRYEYAELLVAQAISQKKLPLTTPFFHNQLKRRITMITQSNLIRRSGYISRIMVLPLLLLLVSAFAVKLKPAAVMSGHFANKNITVVIDPGHGGIYPGAHGLNGILEKDLTLRIAQKIKELSAAYNVNAVLTRNSDELVAGATGLKEDLENRVAVTKDAKADLLVSIHINANLSPGNDPRSGFDAVISAKQQSAESKQLASALLNSLKSIYAVNDAILESNNVNVLNHSYCPAVILECGYITDVKDAEYINNAGNQEKVARKILEGIVQYANAQTGVTAVNIIHEPAGDTLSADEVSKLHVDELSSVDEDLHTNVVTINFKNGDVKYARAAEMNKFYSAHNITDTVPKAHHAGAATNNSMAHATTFTKVEFEPDYPGGQQGWTKFLLANLHYPDAAIKKNIQGTVVMEFIVNTDGTISDIKAISGPQELKEASINVIKQSGNWIPAKQNGKTVRAYKRQPIIYKIA